VSDVLQEKESLPGDDMAMPPLTPAALGSIASVEHLCSSARALYARVRQEVGRAVVGQDEVVDLVLTALFADGHVLLEGAPGLGKTLLVRSLAQALDLPFSRIQFTPDVMPADITGTQIVVENAATGRRDFRFRPGPLFTNLLLADEINRATPKSQSALLEAMQERSVTTGGETRHLSRPFLVMATQNPIEQEGTYPLPEAQLDRFLFKILVPMTTRHEMDEVVSRTTRQEIIEPQVVMSAQSIGRMQAFFRQVPIARAVQDFAVRLVLATHGGAPGSDSFVSRFIRVGASPRAAQALVSSARVRAVIDGRFAVSVADIEQVAHAVLRHRVIRTFEAEAEGITADAALDHLLAGVPRHLEPGQTAARNARRRGGRWRLFSTFSERRQ